VPDSLPAANNEDSHLFIVPHFAVLCYLHIVFRKSRYSKRIHGLAGNHRLPFHRLPGH
jgi:hypothetical protein